LFAFVGQETFIARGPALCRNWRRKIVALHTLTLACA
jgi:hypothetical protein